VASAALKAALDAIRNKTSGLVEPILSMARLYRKQKRNSAGFAAGLRFGK
jgi:hypothetical protein